MLRLAVVFKTIPAPPSELPQQPLVPSQASMMLLNSPSVMVLHSPNSQVSLSIPNFPPPAALASWVSRLSASTSSMLAALPPSISQASPRSCTLPRLVMSRLPSTLTLGLRIPEPWTGCHWLPRLLTHLLVSLKSTVLRPLAVTQSSLAQPLVSRVFHTLLNTGSTIDYQVKSPILQMTMMSVMVRKSNRLSSQGQMSFSHEL